jgi:hypothetical protein
MARIGRSNQQTLIASIILVGIIFVMGAYPETNPWTGPITPFYEVPDPDPMPSVLDDAPDRYCVIPHLEFVGNESEFPVDGDWLVRAEIRVRDDNGFSFREGMALTATNMSTIMIESMGTYSVDNVDNMMVMFTVTIDNGTDFWMYLPTLTIADASIRWHDSGHYVKSYNMIDDGFSMSLFLAQPPASGGVVYDPDPIQDADIKRLFFDSIGMVLAVLFVGFGIIVAYRTRKKVMAAQQSRKPSSTLSTPTAPRIPVKKEPEYTEEELEEMRLEQIRKDNRLKTIEELIQSLTAIKDPQHVLDHAEQTIDFFESEDERELLAFSVLENLYEEVKERLKGE